MKQRVRPGLAITLMAGTPRNRAWSLDELTTAISPRTPEGRRKTRALWVVGVVALVVLLLYAGFVVWVKVISHNAITGAQRLLSQGEPAAARRELGWLLQFRPNHADALTLLGRCLLAEQQFEAAADAFGRVSVDSPHHEEASFSQAIAYLQHRRIEAAEEALVRHLEQYPIGQKHPFSQAAHEELKLVYYNLFRGRELEQFLKASLARHPADFALLADLLLIEGTGRLALRPVSG